MHRLNINFPVEVVNRLKAIANGRTLSEMVRAAVFFYLEHYEKH
jgi:predicted DNA-binding protein